jgi:hypothetical protein
VYVCVSHLVALALQFGANFRSTQGMYISHKDKGDIRRILDNWIHQNVNIIVVTDGSRILGLGYVGNACCRVAVILTSVRLIKHRLCHISDLGANGMGIPIGKLSLYVAGAGFHPCGTLPITLDLGTNRSELIDAPHYLGVRERRIDEELYMEVLDEFVAAVFDKWVCNAKRECMRECECECACVSGLTNTRSVLDVTSLAFCFNSKTFPMSMLSVCWRASATATAVSMTTSKALVLLSLRVSSTASRLLRLSSRMCALCSMALAVPVLVWPIRL